jgi:polypeptide N-acetylgalactosaminyltransferase
MENCKIRSIPDHRVRGCSAIKYDVDSWNLTVSVIITYKDERPDHVRMTLDAILCRTPAKFLKEIVLVDDFNTKPLPDDILIMPKVKVIHNRERQGLIKARVTGK